MANGKDFSLGWCRDLLAAADVVELSASELRPLALEDQLFNTNVFTEAWESEVTLQAWRCLQSKRTSATSFSPEYLLLLAFTPGRSGKASIVHGGVFGALLDQTASLAAVNAAGPTTRTTEINLKYGKPLPLPSVALCRATAIEIAGDNIWVDASFEDGLGGQYCQARIKYTAKRVESL